MRPFFRGMLLSLLVIILFWSCAFLLFGMIKQEPAHWNEYGEQLLMIVAAHLMFTLFLLIRAPWRKSMELFHAMVDAMRRMSKGDFNVNLKPSDRTPGWAILTDSLNRMAVELGQLEQMRQEFIANVSHEIQSPLTSIKGFAQALEGEELGYGDRKHYLTIIQTECSRLSKLSDNLLKLASLDSDHHPFEPKAYRLDKQLREVILSYEPQWTEKELELEVELDEVTLTADRGLMSQVWSNLIHNSIKFTPGGGLIRIQLKQEKDEIQVIISDTGTGILPEHQARVFERFYKADRSRKRSGSESGSGLGLSIAKTIIDKHHGTIALRSCTEQGTTFTVTLPVQPTRVPTSGDSTNFNRGG